MAQQQQLNLAPEALAALLEALMALNLNVNNTSASTPATAPTSAPRAPEDGVAAAVPGGSAQPVLASPSPVPAVVAPSPPSDTPIILRHPFTRDPLPVQPGGSSSSSRVPPTQQPPAQVHAGFHCSHCSAFNPAVGQSSKAYYVVTAGPEVGIFTNWEVVQLLVSGVAHTCHKKYKTCAEAEEAFQAALAQGKVRVL